MKQFFFFLLFSTLLISCSSSPKEDVTGTWIPADVEYDFDLTCEKCNEEQEELMRSQTAISIEGTARSMLKVSYLEFKEKGFEGNLFGDKLDGEYKISGNKLSIKTESKSDKFDISEEDGKTVLNVSASKKELDKIKATRTVPEVGEVSMAMTKLKILFVKDTEE